LVGSPELSRRAPGRVWIRLSDATAQLGLPRSSFLSLAERKGIAITERYGRRGVAATDLDALLERCRIAPSSYGPPLVPYTGHGSPVEVRHLELLDAVAAALSWNDARLAVELGIDATTVSRWRSKGVPNSYLPALRALREAAGTGPVDRLDIAPLLPWGSRCRLEQTHKAARSVRRPRGVALMDKVEARFDWSDHDLSDALGVWPSVISRYRRNGVSAYDIERLRALSRLSPAEVDPPRRLVPKRGVSGLPLSVRQGLTPRQRQTGRRSL
jgi:transcriptional regulator with XRE-family HTH domain